MKSNKAKINVSELLTNKVFRLFGTTCSGTLMRIFVCCVLTGYMILLILWSTGIVYIPRDRLYCVKHPFQSVSKGIWRPVNPVFRPIFCSYYYSRFQDRLMEEYNIFLRKKDNDGSILTRINELISYFKSMEVPSTIENPVTVGSRKSASLYLIYYRNPFRGGSKGVVVDLFKLKNGELTRQ